ncbi:MAG TPA: isochorismate synthase [Stenomitos sp.]
MRTSSKPSLVPTWPQTLRLALESAERSGVSVVVAVSRPLQAGERTRLARVARVFPQVGWAEVDREWLGLGAVDELITWDPTEVLAACDAVSDRLTQVHADPETRAELRYFGGIAFDPTSPPHPAFPEGAPARFVLPQILLHRDLTDPARSRATILLRAMPGESLDHLKDRFEEGFERVKLWQESARGIPEVALGARRVADPEARSRWVGVIRSALAGIDEVQKVVLARQIPLTSSEPLDPWALMDRFDTSVPGYRFCFRFDEGASFVGATPERLVWLEGRTAHVDCLAGTIARGATPEEDAALAAQLLSSEKDRREQGFVVQAVREALEPLCEDLVVPEVPTIRKTPTVQHLDSPVHGTLRAGVCLSDLLSVIYPTPAVCGVPREAARLAIRKLEERPRGWYAGAVGWVGSSGADFAVGIRSAILSPDGAIAFGGGGIVAGSDPEAEFEETERKALSLIRLLEGWRT